MVTLSEDQTGVAAVTFWQHNGWYTRLADGADTDLWLGVDYGPGLKFYDGNHPVVYVGKNQHGSYHNQGGNGDAFGVPTCAYFDDLRRNGFDLDESRIMETEYNLVRLNDRGEEWMLHDINDGVAVLGTRVGWGDGSTTTFDLPSKYVTELTVYVNGLALSDGWSISQDTGVGDTDQIVFNLAPDEGADVTVDYRPHFEWGPGGQEVGVDDDSFFVGTHPTKKDADEYTRIEACFGKNGAVLGTYGIGVSGCLESQGKYGDTNTHWGQFGVYEAVLGNELAHCPAGYTDWGTFCGKGAWWKPWEWRTTSIKRYDLDYVIPASDKGLVRDW